MHLTGSRKGAGTVQGCKSTAKGTKNYLRGLERDLVLDVRASAGAKAYLREDGPKVGSKPHEIAFTEVLGRAAQTLGWDEGGITNQQWEDLYDGYLNGKQVSRPGNRPVVDPETGEKKNERVHNPGFDVQFRNPKSVSVAYALAATQKQADDLDHAMMEAGRFAIKAGVEDYARLARVWVKENGKSVQKDFTADIVVTPVAQHCARPTDETEARGAAADPHMHGHFFVFASCMVNGKWYTANDKALKNTAEFRGELYSAEMARQLELLGYRIRYSEWDKAKNGKIDWEIDGVDPKLMDFLSSNSRRAKVLEKKFEKEHGRKPRPWEINDVMKVTRNKKNDKAFDAMPTRSRWTDDIAAHGFDITPIVPGESITREGDWRLKELERRLFDRGRIDLDTNAHGLLRGRHPAINGDRIKPAIARASVGLGILPEERDHYEALIREQLVVVKGAAEDRNVLYTTREQLALERENRGIANELATSEPTNELSNSRVTRPFECSIDLNLEQIIDRVIARQPIKASEEQRLAVVRACTRSRLEIVVGLAGTGKSLVAKITAEVLKEAGIVDQVVAISMSGKVAQDFGEKIDADFSGSVESIAYRVSKGTIKPTAKTLFLIDEAAMIDSRRINKVFKIVKRCGGRMGMFGDHHQLSPILSAGWFQEHIDAHGNAMLTEVHRHRNIEDVRDYTAIRDGKGHEAVKGLDARGRIHITQDAHSRFTEVMDHYRALRAEGYAAKDIKQVIGTSNVDVDLYGKLVQADRKRRGEISEYGFEVYSEKDRRRWTLHKGDDIMFLRTHISKKYGVVRNGTQGVITELDPSSGMAMVNVGKRTIRIDLNAREAAQPIGQGYAVHVAKFQGSQAQQIQVIAGAEGLSSSNTIYSQVTRAEHEAHIYAHLEDFATLYAQQEYREWHEEIREGVTGDARKQALECMGKAWSKKDTVRTALSYLDSEQKEPTRKKRLSAGFSRGLV